MKKSKKILLSVLLLPVIALVVFACWFLSLKPTGKGDWDEPFARMPKAVFSEDGKTVTIDNLRDFRYRTESDYDIRYRTATYDLDQLETLDYSVTYWNGHELFGHVMLSFGFSDGRHLVFTPEARLKRGQVYELLPGFLRQYELIFLFTTEEDAFRLRTHCRNYEQSQVYLFPTLVCRENIRFVLTDLLKRANGLAENPEFYNGLFYNCLSSSDPTTSKLGIDFCSTWRGVLNGLSVKHGWDIGLFPRERPGESFEEYRERHRINQYVSHIPSVKNYSKLIRTGWKR